MSESPAAPEPTALPEPPDHDGGYHLLFSHPAMVASLLRTFVHEDFVDGLDLEAMERENVKYQAPGLAKRQGDVVWRIPLKDGTSAIYLYLLLEFQSKSDRWMALRLLVYVGLLYQQLLDERTKLIGTRLPPVFALVLHNGEQRWGAPRTLSELIALAPDSKLWAWQPARSYYVVDIAAIAAVDLDNRSNAVSTRLPRDAGPSASYRSRSCLHCVARGCSGWCRSSPPRSSG